MGKGWKKAGKLEAAQKKGAVFTKIAREIQAGYYGRVLDPNHPADPKDQQAFAYPVYVAFLLAPTVGLAFEHVGIGFEWLLIAMTGASVWLWLSALGWRPERK